MPTLQTVREYGNQLVAFYDNGQQVILYPSATGVYVRRGGGTVPQGAGGERTTGGTASNTPGSVSSPVDDYPYPNAPQDDISPLGYSYRDCTDFVAWRINRDAGDTAAPWKWSWQNLRISNGNAIGWRADWQSHGWGVDLAAAPGLIAWYGSTAGAYGHVAYVQSVNTDGTILLEEYNWGGTQHYDTRRVAASSIPSFLGMPPH